MNVEDIRSYCISKEGTDESFPFGPDTLVFKVDGKIFILLSLDSLPTQFNAKCDPDLAEELRAQYDCIKPGYHMNKKHWNTILVNGTLSGTKIKELIDHSYNLVKPGNKKNNKSTKV